jgi:hypothetical protein
MLFAATTHATDSLTASATTSGTTIQAAVSGTADDCGSSEGCTGQAVALVVQPDPEGVALCGANPGTGVLAEQTVPATGGAFSVSGSITEPEGTYAVCGYLSKSSGGASAQLAASNAVVVTIVPQPCPSGTPQPLSLTVPAKLAYGQRGAVGVSDRIAGVELTSVVLTMNVAGRPQPFSTRTFSGGDIASIELANTKTFSTHVARGSAPTIVSLSSVEIATATCTMSLSAEITPVPGSAPVARFESKPPGGRSGARVVFSAPGGCSVTAAVPASVFVSGRSAELAVSAKNVCGRWRHSGRIPGVSVELKANGNGEVIEFHASSRTSGRFRVTVRVDGHVVRRGVFHVHAARQLGPCGAPSDPPSRTAASHRWRLIFAVRSSTSMTVGVPEGSAPAPGGRCARGPRRGARRGRRLTPSWAASAGERRSPGDCGQLPFDTGRRWSHRPPKHGLRLVDLKAELVAQPAGVSGGFLLLVLLWRVRGRRCLAQPAIVANANPLARGRRLRSARRRSAVQSNEGRVVARKPASASRPDRALLAPSGDGGVRRRAAVARADGAEPQARGATRSARCPFRSRPRQLRTSAPGRALNAR